MRDYNIVTTRGKSQLMESYLLFLLLCRPYLVQNFGVLHGLVYLLYDCSNTYVVNTFWYQYSVGYPWLSTMMFPYDLLGFH